MVAGVIIEMNYKRVKEGIFLSRPNRFIAHVEIDGMEEIVHVKNTSRCRELLIPGVTVYLEISENPARKTGFSLISVIKDGRLINIDSQAPNKVCGEALLSGALVLPGLHGPIVKIKPESTFGASRLDFYLEAQENLKAQVQKAFIEVKGVTLENKGVLRFPDAPTERGLKHVKELIKAAESGYLAYILFVIQMKEALYFEPNDDMHAAFGSALRQAEQKGVKILAYDCYVSPVEITLAKQVEVRL